MKAITILDRIRFAADHIREVSYNPAVIRWFDAHGEYETSAETFEDAVEKAILQWRGVPVQEAESAVKPCQGVLF